MHRPWKKSHETWSSQVSLCSLLFLLWNDGDVAHSFLSPPSSTPPPGPLERGPLGKFHSNFDEVHSQVTKVIMID
ncbi:hypothetical protein HZ326_14751 [Fusarium oxysporum f. sp. albedinis]|nr:hypothetical protein HZ326_14751 [Fusarium oxysporum f. sp. albedinis]